MVICTKDSFQLLGEWQTLLGDTDYGMILLDLRVVVKARHVGVGILEIYSSMILIHRFLIFGCKGTNKRVKYQIYLFKSY